MKRLFETSVGVVEVDVDPAARISVWRFGDDGRPVQETGDEWENADLADLLATEAGVPPDEARRIDADFARDWVEAGNEAPAGPGSAVVALTIFGLLLVALGVGIVTILRAAIGWIG